MNKKRFFWQAFVIGLIALLALAGCSSSGGSQPAGGPAASNGSGSPSGSGDQVSPGGSASGSAALEPVQLGVPHRSLFTVGMPVYVAMEKGFYEEVGLVVEPVFTKGGGDTVQAVITGDIDIALETGPAAILSAYLQGAPLKIISSSATGFDIYWMVKADSPVQKMEDISGEKIGFSSPGSSTDLAVRAMNEVLTSKGLAEAQPQAVGSPPDQMTAVLTDQIAAGFGTPPFGLQEIKDGKVRIAIKGTELEAYNNVAARVNFANAKYFQEHPESVKAFLQAHQKAWEWIFANPEESAEIWIKRAELKEDVETLLTAFDLYTPEMVRLAPLDGVDKIIEDALKFDFIDEAPTEEQLKDLIDLQYVPQ